MNETEAKARYQGLVEAGLEMGLNQILAVLAGIAMKPNDIQTMAKYQLIKPGQVVSGRPRVYTPLDARGAYTAWKLRASKAYYKDWRDITSAFRGAMRGEMGEAIFREELGWQVIAAMRELVEGMGG